MCAASLNRIIGIIANGECSPTQNRASEFVECTDYYAVDGGLNTCHPWGISLRLIVGDFDSVDPKLLSEYRGVRQIRFDRAKDKTDLESAIEHAFNVDRAALVRVFGGLGKRCDHALYNLFLISRYPGRVELVTEEETIRCIDPVPSRISSDTGLTLVSLFSPQIEVITDDKKVYRVVEPLFLQEQGLSLRTKEGRLLAIVQKTDLQGISFEETKEGIPYSFALADTTARMFSLFAQGLTESKWVGSEEQRVFILTAEQGEKNISSQQGLTLSLIPYRGPAEVTTRGLKWELREEELNCDFLSISNVALGETVSITVHKGILLVCLNPSVIDREMVGLVDRTTTAGYTSAACDSTETV